MNDSIGLPETDEADDEGGQPRTVGMVPSRLGAPWRLEQWPTELVDGVRTSIRWQEHGPDAELWEVHGASTWQGFLRLRGRVYDIIGCMAGIGEQLALACSAGREYLSWEAMPTAHDPIEAEMAKRAMAELQIQYLVGLGHGLFNLACRTVAMDLDLHDEMTSRLRTDCPPSSDDPKDWPTANANQAKRLRAVAQNSAVDPIRGVVGPVSELLYSDEWKELNKCRSEFFHQWRPQSAGLTGTARRSPWKLGSAGSMSIDLGSGVLGVDAATKRAADTFQVASEARDRIVATMTQFESLPFEVFGALPEVGRHFQPLSADRRKALTSGASD